MPVTSHLAFAVLTGAFLASTEAPVIDHEPIDCSLAGKNVRICAYVLDDGEIERTRVYFRAAGRDAFYWTRMLSDGIQFCATLPVASGVVRALEYYVWVVDDRSETTRTRTLTISLGSSCSDPAVDEDPERTHNLVVHATTDEQGDVIEDFEAGELAALVPVDKR
ncbi:MAG TPA: hypothetical protein VEK15_13005 [Vicinamibacteria bacterium]|nr:hypothetical protein [Vicinamibacteria bacterium]